MSLSPLPKKADDVVDPQLDPPPTGICKEASFAVDVVPG
jgi:hypothetical protein